MKETILCMFSGGLDSTAILYKLLTADEYLDYNIHVHHIHLRNLERRAVAESFAIKKIFVYLEENKFRHFDFTENIFETFFLQPPQFKRFPFDTDILAFIIANMAIGNASITKAMFGISKTDLDMAIGLSIRVERIQEILKAVFYPNAPTVDITSPLVHLTRQEEYNMLPEKLRNLTWSCRNPIYDDDGIPSICGKCLTCKEMEEIG